MVLSPNLYVKSLALGISLEMYGSIYLPNCVKEHHGSLKPSVDRRVPGRPSDAREFRRLFR